MGAVGVPQRQALQREQRHLVSAASQAAWPSDAGGTSLALFGKQGIPWSTGAVLERTLDVARRIGLSVAPTSSLPTLRDIDTAQDLRDWAAAVEAAAASDGSEASVAAMGEGAPAAPGGAEQPAADSGGGEQLHRHHQPRQPGHGGHPLLPLLQGIIRRHATQPPEPPATGTAAVT